MKVKIYLFLSLLICLSTTSLYAQASTIHWTGAIDNKWNNPGNWNLNRVPDSADVVDIPINHFVRLTDSTTISHLKIGGHARLSLLLEPWIS